MEPYTYPADCFFKSLEDIRGKKITIMGLGLNGGGQAAVRFFLKHGAFLTVTDMKTEEELSPTLRALEKDIQKYRDNITFVLGRHDIQDFSQADVVIKNPGVKIQGNKYLAAAKAIETDISVFLKFTQAPIIAVTGSKGKSSTVSAIHYGLQNAGFKTFLGGNITVSPLTFLEETDKNTPVVLELSSWQLADLRGRGLLKPFIALLTLIVPDHQNWYGSMESYVADKKLQIRKLAQNKRNNTTQTHFDACVTSSTHGLFPTSGICTQCYRFRCLRLRQNTVADTQRTTSCCRCRSRVLLSKRRTRRWEE